MASSSSSAIKELLAGYLTGRVKADRVVTTVAEAYYENRGTAREQLQPLMDVIERAAPGMVDLVRTEGGAGFDIRLAERPFPKQYEAELRRAAETVLGGTGGGTVLQPGFLVRLARAVRRLFSASA